MSSHRSSRLIKFIDPICYSCCFSSCFSHCKSGVFKGTYGVGDWMLSCSGSLKLNIIKSIDKFYKTQLLLMLVLCNENPFRVSSDCCSEQQCYLHNGQMLIQWEFILQYCYLFLSSGNQFIISVYLLCLSGQEMAPTRKRPLLKDSWHQK